jgi:hypothetical protein
MPKNHKNNTLNNESRRQNSKPGAAAWGNDSSISPFRNTPKHKVSSRALSMYEVDFENIDLTGEVAKIEGNSCNHTGGPWEARLTAEEIKQHKRERGKKPTFAYVPFAETIRP